jgi:hypothetical protein
MKTIPQCGPNGIWDHLGYSINRCARGGRTITRPDGSVVDTITRVHEREDGYARELRAGKAELASHGFEMEAEA